MTKKKPFDFESTLSSLTEIVENLESSELSLEESLKNFENGINLTRISQLAIEEASQRVNLLLEENTVQGEPLTQSFVDEGESDT